MYPMTNCPEDFSLGYRTTPGQKVPEFAGNTCEVSCWQGRMALVAWRSRVLIVTASLQVVEPGRRSETAWFCCTQPWIARYAVVFLDKLIDTGTFSCASAVEWCNIDAW